MPFLLRERCDRNEMLGHAMQNHAEAALNKMMTEIASNGNEKNASFLRLPLYFLIIPISM